METADKWLDWLSHGRDAGDPELAERTMRLLREIRDGVLSEAQISPGDHVLDVGTGEGLLGLAALDMAGPAGHVTFSDISAALIRRLEEAAKEIDHGGRTSFTVCDAENLEGVPPGSIDAVVARSVLIYVQDRRSFFQAAFQVLRAGGRFAIYEPVASFFPMQEDSSFFGWQLPPDVRALAARVKDFYESDEQRKDNAALLSLTVNELVEAAEGAGFGRVTARLTAESKSYDAGDDKDVTQVLRGRPNPNTPSVLEVAQSLLSPSEVAEFCAALELAVRDGNGRDRHAHVMLSGSKSPQR